VAFDTNGITALGLASDLGWASGLGLASDLVGTGAGGGRGEDFVKTDRRTDGKA